MATAVHTGQSAGTSAATGVTITDVQVLTFKYTSYTTKDDEGHTHPGPGHEAQRTLMRVRSSAGVDGYAFGGSAQTAAVARRMIVGMNLFDRERIWKKLLEAQRLEWQAFGDRNLCAVDLALWDAAGKIANLPVHAMIGGGGRTKIPAYASTMCGDDIPGGLDTPEAYAEFAQACVAKGYPAFKLHTWMAPYGPNLKRDIAACAAVRNAVGPGIKLMLDPHHDYTREEALYLGRAIEELDYYWMEEPMNEHNTSSFIWLTEKLDLPICGPETAAGQHFTRAEWIMRGASDLLRVGVSDVGGLTPSLKVAHLCECFGMRLEVHSPGAANLQLLASMAFPGEFYERGLLHPHVDYDKATPWLATLIDPVDAEGCVPVPQGPGLGEEIAWDFIAANTVRDWH